MHLIQDENGNSCPHSHGHGENAGHCETGCGGCAGGHDHSHHHSPEAVEPDKLAALLDYMLKHNEHHAAELDQVSEKLRAAGKTAAAEQIKKAVDEFQKGNLYLSLALSSVKEGA